MSRLAPVTNDKTTKYLIQAVQLIKSKAKNGDKFTTSKDNDPHNSLGGNYPAVEGKNIFTAVMVSGLWPALRKKFPELPEPADCQAGFRISSAQFWPENADVDGLIGHAADQQVNTLADVAFTHLMYESNKSTARAHHDLIEEYKANKEANKEAQMDLDDDELAQEQEEEFNSKFAVAAKALPPAWSVDRKFRLTRDWTNWPSAGPLSSEVSNVQQAQYGVMADLAYETTKVRVIAAKKTRGEKYAPTIDDAAQALVDDEDAQSIYFDLLNKYAEIDGNKLYVKAGKLLKDEADKFAGWVLYNEDGLDMSYTDSNGVTQKFDVMLQGISGDYIPGFFLAACKTRKLAENAGSETASVISKTPAVADDESLTTFIDDSEDIDPAPTRGRGRGRGGRGRGGSTTRGGAAQGGGRGGAYGDLGAASGPRPRNSTAATARSIQRRTSARAQVDDTAGAKRPREDDSAEFNPFGGKKSKK